MDCIVNVTQNWGIGRDGDLLVSIPTDLRRFRALTTGKTVIYGRKTLLTFPHALLPWCSRVLLTQTCADLPADRFFPDLDRLPNWRCTDTGPLQEDGGHCFRYLTYENDAPLPL